MSEDKKILDELERKIDQETDNFNRELESVKNITDLERIRTKFTGRKSFLAGTLKKIGRLPKNLKPLFGKRINIVREKIEYGISKKEEFLKSIEYENKLKEEIVDLSLPGRKVRPGKKNVISQTIEEIEQVFIGMGFEVVEGPEAETDYLILRH